MFYLRSGKIKISVTSAQGKEAVIAILGPSEFFGEGCLLGQPRQLVRAIAMQDSTAMRLGKLTMPRCL
jgi:CRP/FNR family transcriptional regulator, cyclic AMP receptor protein